SEVIVTEIKRADSGDQYQEICEKTKGNPPEGLAVLGVFIQEEHSRHAAGDVDKENHRKRNNRGQKEIPETLEGALSEHGDIEHHGNGRKKKKGNPTLGLGIFQERHAV